MAERLIVDLDEGSLAWPLDESALEDLRWYLEDYLTAPFAVYEDRGAGVESRLAGWGRDVFTAVLGSGQLREAYLRACEHGAVELVLQSSSSAQLGLPWELMTAPGGEAPLAVDVAGVSRSLVLTADVPQAVPVPGGRLRVLMVISRPAGRDDVGYRMVARPLLDRLEAVRGRVELVVLRPPTLDALRLELGAGVEAGTPYQVVHFDGHGTFLGPKTADGGEGVLVFERPDGGPQYVPARAIAPVLAASGVPVVVLNACQSGAVGKELEAAIATRLLRAGTASVVAMAYSVYAVAAAEFMAAFYERLFAGGTVASAVTAGRRQLYCKPGRPSPKGELPLADWVVPVHYSRREVSFPQAVLPRPEGQPSLAEALESARGPAGDTGRGDLDAVQAVFVGRDALFYDLEEAARLRKVVVVAGPGGTGKTELAKAFARWWRDTGAVETPDLIFWHSFEPGIASFGLDGVITEIGNELFGTQFALLGPEQRRAAVLDALIVHRMLLVWDNFEAVRSMPDPGGGTPTLDEDGCAEICDFLADLGARGESSVLITSRTPEDWLGEVARITIGGLAVHEAAEYADILLAPYPSARASREGRAFGDLMQWLDGHPLSMRLTLPRLADTAPEALLARLQGTAPPSGDDDAELGRTRSLAASIGYSYAHLAESTRRLLPALSLLHALADPQVLGVFSQGPDAPRQFAGAPAEAWEVALDDATRVGLLTKVGDTYDMHPALPGYLAAAWRGEDPGGYHAAREAATIGMIGAHAAWGNWLFEQIRSGGAGPAYSLIGLTRATLGVLLGYAVDHAEWRGAQAIVQPLQAYWEARGLDAEADHWADRVQTAVEGPDGTPPRLDTREGDLWQVVTTSRANRRLRRGQFDEAERDYSQILSGIESAATSPSQQRRLSVAYHQLGTAELERGHLTKAEELYRKALAVQEDMGDLADQARTYFQLGRVAEQWGRLADAEEWALKSLATMEEIGDRPGIAMGYYQLGKIAHALDRLPDAEDWCRKSLALATQLGDRPGIGRNYHMLGTLAYGRDRLAEAEDWYRKSLGIVEEIGDRHGMATTYHELGRVAQDGGRFDEAGRWYHASLPFLEELGDLPAIVRTCGQLGLLAEEQGQLHDALAWMVACVTIFDDFLHPLTGPGPANLARLTAQLGMPALENSWLEVKGDALPGDVRDWVEDRIRERGGG